MPSGDVKVPGVPGLYRRSTREYVGRVEGKDPLGDTRQLRRPLGTTV
jgi:hypothetical protein